MAFEFEILQLFRSLLEIRLRMEFDSGRPKWLGILIIFRVFDDLNMSIFPSVLLKVSGESLVGKQRTLRDIVDERHHVLDARTSS